MTDPADAGHRITSVAALEALYGAASPRALIKEIDHLSAEYRAFLDAAPFVLLASSGPGGLDCSPRGDPAGFVHVRDPRTVEIPDRPGNNRLDTLRNLIDDPRIALLALIPGVGETLRINGTATLLTAPEVLDDHAIGGRRPACVIRIAIASVYFQCPKALIRSRLWSAEAQVPRNTLPSPGAMLEAIEREGFDGAAYDADFPGRMERTLY
jgi:hypothetical protein